jgi:tRNA(fMet)-specific endonuclease VapC
MIRGRVMVRYMLDSCVCIDFMRGRLPLGYEVLRKSDPRLFGIPAVVAAELRLGAEKSRDAERNRLLVESFLLPFEIVPFDSACSIEYARIRAELESKGTPIGPNDYLIAATARACGAVLVTNDDSEFKRVNDLTLESWYEVDL